MVKLLKKKLIFECEKNDFENFSVCSPRGQDLNFSGIVSIFPQQEIIESNGPIELYFKEKEIRPLKIISSGSGATETLNLIYGVDVDITMPMIENCNPSCRDNVELRIKHLEKSYSVSFL